MCSSDLSSKTLNDTIKAYTDEIITAYEADVKAAGGEGVEDLSLDYEIVTDNDTLFSLRFEQCITMAGANQSQKIYHIDKSTGKMIRLKDLFQENADYQAVISENIKTFLELAFSTRSKIFDTVDSPNSFVVRIRSTPVMLIQPLITSPKTHVQDGATCHGSMGNLLIVPPKPSPASLVTQSWTRKTACGSSISSPLAPQV